MRTILKSSTISVALAATVLAACGKQAAPTDRAMNDDLKRDLAMAASSGLDLASEQKSANFPLTEVAQTSAPRPSTSLQKAAGPKATRSKHPTVKASPEPSVVKNAEEPQTEVMAEAPSQTTEAAPDPSAPAVPRPSPVPVDAGIGGEGTRGQSGGGANPGAGDGGGSILGGIFGVIIRGGVVDGDHCDPRSDGRRRGGRTLPQDPRIGLPRGGGYPYPSIPSRLPRM